MSLRATGRLRSTLPLIATCALVEVAGALWVHRLCEIEAAVGAMVIRPIMGASYHRAGQPTLSFPIGGGGFRALEITWQCSSLLAATPILLVGSLAALLPNARPRQVAALIAGGLLVTVAANQARILVIAAATAQWGDDGFELSHRVVGSGIVLLSIVAALAAIVRTQARRR